MKSLISSAARFETLDTYKLQRMKRELNASKRNLQALDCEYVTLNTGKIKQENSVEKKQAKETIEVVLKYGFDESNAKVITDTPYQN